MEIKDHYILVVLKKSYKLHWKKLIGNKYTFNSKQPEEDEQQAEEADGQPLSKIMDMMKLLYQKGGSEMQQDIQKAWVKAENKYKNAG